MNVYNHILPLKIWFRSISIMEKYGEIQEAKLCLHYPKFNIYIYIYFLEKRLEEETVNYYQLYQLSIAV